MDVAAQSGGQAAGDDPEGSAQGVTPVPCLVDRLHHPGRRRRFGAADHRHLDLLLGDATCVDRLKAQVDLADRLGEAQDLDAEVPEQLPADGPGRHPRCRLPGARALEHVADVVVPVLEHPGQVGVAGPELGHRLRRESLLERRHLRGPVGVVAVLEHDRDRAPDREAAPDAPHEPTRVHLDLLPVPPPVAALPAAEVAAEVVGRDLETGGQAFDEDGQLGTVGLACREPAELRHDPLQTAGGAAGAASPVAAVRSLSARPKTSSRNRWGWGSAVRTSAPAAPAESISIRP